MQQLRLALAGMTLETIGHAASALDQTATQAAVETLLQVLAQEEEGLDEDSAEQAIEARVHAALMLGHIRDPHAVEPLLQILATAELSVKWYVIDALGMIADSRAIEPLIEALGHQDIDMRKAAWRALAAVGKPAVTPLLGVLMSDAHYLAPWALGDIGDHRAVVPLIEVLQNRQRVEQIRYGAAVALGKLEYTHAFDLFIQMLQDSTESALMHNAAVLGLGHLRDGRAGELLLRLIETNMRRVAVEALGLIGDACALDRLLFLLQTDPHVRGAAAKALGEIGDPRALPFLKQQQQKLSEGDSRLWSLRAALDQAIERIEQHRTDS
jgi:HEAT repeat protein